MKNVETNPPVRNAIFCLIKGGMASKRSEVVLWFEKRKKSDAVFKATTNLDGNRIMTLRTSVKQRDNTYLLKFNRRDLRMALSILEQDADPSVKRKPNELVIGDTSVGPDIKPS